MFAIRIKNLRQSKELNQVQLAEKLGVKKQSISNWENDNIMPSIDMLKKLRISFTSAPIICWAGKCRRQVPRKCWI